MTDELPAAEAGRFFSTSHPPCDRTIWRWIKTGLRAPGGGIVKLVPRRVGCRIYVTREAADAFMAAMNPEMVERQVVQSASSRAKAACAALEKLGA